MEAQQRQFAGFRQCMAVGDIEELLRLLCGRNEADIIRGWLALWSFGLLLLRFLKVMVSLRSSRR